MTVLHVSRVGAVTAIGLDASQTCAAFRAGVSGFRQVALRPPPDELLRWASVPARALLRRSHRGWLLHLAVRAIGEALLGCAIPIEHIVLILVLPEPERRHPAFAERDRAGFLEDLERMIGKRFHTQSRIVDGGRAAGIAALLLAERFLANCDMCLICGVDSLLNDVDTNALITADRMHCANQPQGVIPGEGAACVLVTSVASTSIARILGWSQDSEENTVFGDLYSNGEGLFNAIERAVDYAQVSEPDVAFRVSDMNGERYRAWESFMAGTRYYRTHRERLPIWLPAAAMGDMGAASGVLTLVLAAMAMARGYAPGLFACCESASDGNARAAAIVAPAPNAPIPPFRSRHSNVSSRSVIREIVTQHVEDVGALRRMRRVRTDSSVTGRDALRMLDDRLDAHLDALAVAAESGWKAASMQFGADDADTEFAACVIALESRDMQKLEHCLALAEAIPATNAAFSDALGWVSDKLLVGTAVGLLTHSSAYRRALGITAYMSHRIDPGAALKQAIEGMDERERRAAFCAAGELGRKDLLPQLLAALDNASKGVQFDACRAAVMLGDRTRSLSILRELALSDFVYRDEALTWACLVLSVEDAQALLSTIARAPEEGARLVKAVGLTGDPRYLDWLVHEMEAGLFARSAWHSFCLITGIDLHAPQFRLSMADAPDIQAAKELALADPEGSDVPLPRPDAVRSWLEAHRGHFKKGVRLFLGEPASAAVCNWALASGTQRVRHIAAHYCVLLSGGPSFDCNGPSWRQDRVLRRVR
jgi:uncharacterized protein (TIGR02270 family)